MSLKDYVSTLNCKAPCFAFPVGLTNNMRVARGCCDRWACDRCRPTVAKRHHDRVVFGATQIDKLTKQAMADLYIITTTCRGRELSRDVAMTNYFDWTTKFLDACYAKNKRDGVDWYYAQITELQKRGHPHSHFLMNWNLTEFYHEEYKGKPRLRVKWLEKQLARVGLGSQYDIQVISDINHVASYVAKYLFKQSVDMIYDYPKKWKRVRYSQSWPKLDLDPIDAIPLASEVDWLNMYYRATKIECKGDNVQAIADIALRDLPSKFV